MAVCWIEGGVFYIGWGFPFAVIGLVVLCNAVRPTCETGPIRKVSK